MKVDATHPPVCEGENKIKLTSSGLKWLRYILDLDLRAPQPFLRGENDRKMLPTDPKMIWVWFFEVHNAQIQRRIQELQFPRGKNMSGSASWKFETGPWLNPCKNMLAIEIYIYIIVCSKKKKAKTQQIWCISDARSYLFPRGNCNHRTRPHQTWRMDAESCAAKNAWKDLYLQNIIFLCISIEIP